jgi:hypothetical protein
MAGKKRPHKRDRALDPERRQSYEHSAGDQLIDERLIDGLGHDPREVEAAAQQGFILDQDAPDAPTRVERSLAEREDVKNPSHSRGSQA